LTLARQRTITGYIFISPFFGVLLGWIPALVAVYGIPRLDLISAGLSAYKISSNFSDPLLPHPKATVALI
jgi:hypothetical protein